MSLGLSKFKLRFWTIRDKLDRTLKFKIDALLRASPDPAEIILIRRSTPPRTV